MGPLGPSWGHLGAPWGPPEPSCARLGPIWAHLGPIWGSLGLPGPILSSSWAHVRLTRALLGHLPAPLPSMRAGGMREAMNPAAALRPELCQIMAEGKA